VPEELTPEELEEEPAAAEAPGGARLAGVERQAGPDVASASAVAESGSGLFDPAAYSAAEKRALLTALLFASGEVLEAARLADYLGLSKVELTVLAEEAAGELRPRGLDILAAASGLRLVTAAQWDEPLAQFHRQVRRAKLSRGALEILAVIAYEQPVARTRIDDLRQVNSESTIRTLLDRRLITVTGRAETPGRPFLYRTTERFLEVFGLDTLGDLPPRPAVLDLPPGEGLGQEFGLDALPDFSADEFEEA
jgi:segregation and condensation protein B